MSQSAKLAWRSEDTPAEIAGALRVLECEYPISEGGRGLKVKFCKVSGDTTLSNVERNRGGVTIEYTNLAGALRGVGSALAKLDGEERTPYYAGCVAEYGHAGISPEKMAAPSGIKRLYSVDALL